MNVSFSTGREENPNLLVMSEDHSVSLRISLDVVVWIFLLELLDSRVVYSLSHQIKKVHVSFVWEFHSLEKVGKTSKL